MSSPPSENPGYFPEANDDIEFAFNFNGQLKSPPLSAAELFDGGKIKPLKLLPRSQYWASNSPESPRSPKRMITPAFIMSPRRKKKMDSHSLLRKTEEEKSVTYSTARHKGSKCSSATLTTVFNKVSESTKIQQSSKETTACLSSSSFGSTSSSSSSSSSSWSRKWKFLFRSTSEGHATSKDVDYACRKNHNEDLKNLSFRSEDSVNLGSRGNRRKKGRVSAHEWHYKKNRAATEERRRKTFLPYKKNLLGCMVLDPGVSKVFRWIGVEIKC